MLLDDLRETSLKDKIHRLLGSYDQVNQSSCIVAQYNQHDDLKAEHVHPFPSILIYHGMNVRLAKNVHLLQLSFFQHCVFNYVVSLSQKILTFFLQ